MNWPNDVDGDVFRRLESDGFDFTTECVIDVNIDFETWPLDDDAKSKILSTYPNPEFIDPDDEDIAEGILIGYVQFRYAAKLTYDLIMDIQSTVTTEMAPFGGRCESWGVSHG